MFDPKKLLFAAVAICALGLLGVASRAAEEGHTMTGVLIDNACGAKQADEAAAAKHPIACTKKEACAASGYQLVVGEKHYKLDPKGNDQAKEYLAKAETTHVIVAGKMDGEVMVVTSIKPVTAK